MFEVEMKLFNYKQIWWRLAVFFSGFFMLSEWLIGLAEADGFWSAWTLTSLIYNIIAIDADIYIWSWLKIDKRLKNLSLINRLNKSQNISNGRWHKILRDLGYVGLVMAAAINSLGRIGTFIFVMERKKLPRGRYFLYAGCVLRLPLTFYGLRAIFNFFHVIFH